MLSWEYSVSFAGFVPPDPRGTLKYLHRSRGGDLKGLLELLLAFRFLLAYAY
jgi:hypothetical protein